MNDDLNTGDTIQAEGETAATTPDSEQTPQENEGAESTTKPEENEDAKPVPYARFKEVNERSKQYEAKLKEVESKLAELDKRSTSQKETDPQEQQVKSLLNQYGYMSRDEVEAELNKREARLREDAQVERELSRLESKYNGKNGLPKFDRQEVINFALEKRIADPEVAYKALFEKEWLNWNIQHANELQKGVKAEKSDGSGAPPAGPANQDLMDAAMSGDDKAFDTLIRRSNVFSNFFKK